MKMRIVGAILIVVISVPIIWLGGIPFTISCGILGAFALKELMELKEHHKQIPNTLFILSVVDLLLLLFLNVYPFLPLKSYQLLALVFLNLFLPSIFYKNEQYTTHEAMYLFGSVCFLSLFFSGLLSIRFTNIWLLVYLIFIAIFTDTFAFLIGASIGKHKCSPLISPNKTWEGSIGGVLFGVMISSVFYLNVLKNLPFWKILLLSTLLSIIGELGDLVFSKMKRENKIKDFSHIIPGHGGILDRLDSLVFIVLGYLFLIGIL